MNDAFALTGIDRQTLRSAARVMMQSKTTRPPWMKKYASIWIPDNPLRGFCYLASEVAWWYCAPKGSRAFMLKIDVGQGEEHHRFLMWPDGQLVDLTAEQFEGVAIPYHLATPKNFMSIKPGPSRLARVLAGLVGFPEVVWRHPSKREAD